MILSILIAAFNVERFLERCLASIAGSKCFASVEVVIVDDGSSDGTSRIANEFASRHANVSVIMQDNGGLGAARNAGLSGATGKYVWFLDGDDFIHPDALCEVVSALQASDPDVLVVDLSCADESGAPIAWIESGFRESVGNTMTGAEFFRRHYRTTYTWLFVFRRDLLLRNRLTFQPRINMQDAEFLPRAMEVAASVLVSGVVAYVYVKRSNSYTNSVDASVREAYFRSVVEVRRRLAAQFELTTDAIMREGLAAKLDAVDGILMMAYIYDEIDAQSRAARLAILRAQGVYPFSAATSTSGRHPSARDRVLRMLVNLIPNNFPPMFRSVRRNSVLMGILRGQFLKASAR